MPVSVFGTALEAGLEPLLRALVQRDLEKKDKEDRMRRADLDAKASLREERNFGLQQQQMERLDAQAAEQRRMNEAKLTEMGTQKLLQFEADKQRQDAINAFMNAAPEDKERLGLELTLKHGIKLPEPKTEAGFTLGPGQQRFGPDGKPLASVPDRPRTPSGGGGGKATPNQVMMAGRNAVRDAQVEERNGMLPSGMTVADRAVELREQYLTDLGVDVPPRPVVAPPPVHDPRETASLGTGVISNIRGLQPEAAQPIQRPIPGIPGAIAESTDGGKTWKRVK